MSVKELPEIKIDPKKLVLLPVGELKPNPKNRNKHPVKQIERLAEIIRYQGFRQPVIVSSRSGLVVVGHGRLEAAKALGMSHVPVVFQDFESDEQEYAFQVSDNAIAAWAELDLAGINADLADLGPDFNLDLLGLKDFILEPAEKAGEDPGVGEPPAEPKTRPGDIYILGEHRLMCGDATNADNLTALMAGDVAELCFTSPPYADQREYNGGKDLSTEHLATFIRTAFGSCRYFAVNLGYSRKGGEVNAYWDDYIREANSCGLAFLSWNIWDRASALSLGQVTAMFPIEHEWVFVFGPSPKNLNCTVPNKYAGDKLHGTDRNVDGSMKKKPTKKIRSHRPMGTIYRGDAARFVGEDHQHPAMFPVEFSEAYLEAMSNPGDVVYEPFGGSGTTLVAAEKLSRRCRIMELDPKYCDVIVARWEKYTGKKAELLNGEG